MFEQHGPVEPRVPLAEARVLVLGLGLTGRSVAAALSGRCKTVTTVAPQDAADAPLPAADDAEAISTLVADADLVVASPGFKPTEPLIVAAQDAGVPVWSEAELAWRLRVTRDGLDQPAPWLAITGTNGKTTTVEMLASMLAAAGHNTRAVGNVGTPLIEAALDPTLDVLAVELSSFQLHFSHTLALAASAVLNLAEDHLDWHGTMDAYARDKGRIYENAVTAVVYNAQDAVTERLVREAEVEEGCRAIGFTLGLPGPGQLGVMDDAFVDRAFHADFDDPARRGTAAVIATTAELEHLSAGGSLPPHVVANALAAAALARAFDVPATAIRDGLRAFAPVGHRIQVVRELDGVTYVDDSKATNPHAASAALAGFGPQSVVWILGGLAKGADLAGLVAERADRLRAAVVIGVDAAPYVQALTEHASGVPVERIDPAPNDDVMSRAVAAARALARPGDTVLLAPAGASQDQFANYNERGDAFAAAAKAL